MDRKHRPTELTERENVCRWSSSKDSMYPMVRAAEVAERRGTITLRSWSKGNMEEEEVEEEVEEEEESICSSAYLVKCRTTYRL